MNKIANINNWDDDSFTSEFGIRRPSIVTFSIFFWECIKSNTNHMKIAVWYCLSKTEYDSFTESALCVWRSMWGTMFLIFIALFAVIGIFGSGTAAVSVFGIIVAPILLSMFILVYFMCRIDHGLLLYADQYGYDSEVD